MKVPFKHYASGTTLAVDHLLAAVGQLQFEVVQARLKNEYNIDSLMEPLSYSFARWVDGG